MPQPPAPRPSAPAPPADWPILNVATLELEWEARQPWTLPGFPGAAVRGALGRALRDATCLTGAPACDGCDVADRCAFGSVWEAAPREAIALTPPRRGTPPAPYVLSVAPTPDVLHPGDRLRARIRLIGTARTAIPALVSAAARAFALPGAEPALRLLAIHRRGPGTRAAAADTPEGASVRSPLDRRITPTPGPEPAAPRSVQLHLATPLALSARRLRAQPLRPETLTARLSERLDRLAQAYEGQAPAWPWRELREASAALALEDARLRRVSFLRHAPRGGHDIRMEGIAGTAIVRDVPPAVLSLWRTAAIVHVGSFTTFGFGKLLLDVLD